MVMTVAALPPTVRLPPITTLKNVPIGVLNEAIQYLQSVYNPEIRSSRRIINHGSAPRRPAGGPIHDAGSNANNDRDQSMQSIRADAFENAYAVRWLTALVAQMTTTLGDDADDTVPSTSTSSRPDLELEPLVQSAAALLAVCAGAASAGTRTRTYVLCGVRVRLTDVALRNDDFGSVGAQTWGSACVLAEMIAEAPARFGLCSTGGANGSASFFDRDHDEHPSGAGAAAIRVLELGAGTGLVGLTIARILETSRCCERDSGRAAEIILSDFYPLALENLRLNIQHDFDLPSQQDDDFASDPAGARGGLTISAHLLDWEEAADPTRVLEGPFDIPFDEVFGADIVYELEHATWINACLKRVLRLTGRFHLVIPLREGFARESATVERVFPRAEDIPHAMDGVSSLCITNKEDITCEAWPDGKGEVEYVHYTIQWRQTGAGLHEW